MRWYNTLIPYKKLEHLGIQYTTCRNFDHISRYRGLRQVVHCPSTDDIFVTLEIPNPFTTNNTDVTYYEVPVVEENRLDIIAYKFLGNSNYSWVIAYLNGIGDGCTVKAGTKLKIPKSITALFNKGELLQSVSPVQLNLGTE